VHRLPALPIGLLLLVATALGAGCGEGGTDAGAIVSVYAAAPLCAEARHELAQAGVEAGDLKVRAICLVPVEAKGGADLAAAGANARRATEDSTAVAFLEAPGPAARFSRSVVGAANIAWVETSSGAVALRHVLRALGDAGSSSPREVVLEQVG